MCLEEEKENNEKINNKWDVIIIECVNNINHAHDIIIFPHPNTFFTSPPPHHIYNKSFTTSSEFIRFPFWKICFPFFSAPHFFLICILAVLRDAVVVIRNGLDTLIAWKNLLNDIYQNNVHESTLNKHTLMCIHCLRATFRFRSISPLLKKIKNIKD